MNRAGTHITNEGRPAIGNFMLDVQVPPDVRTMRRLTMRLRMLWRLTKLRLGSGAPVPRGIRVGPIIWKGAVAAVLRPNSKEAAAHQR